MVEKTRKRPRGFGEVSKLPSRNYRARYVVKGTRYSAPKTFPTAAAADAWLAKTHAAVASGTWEPPELVAAREAAQQAELERQAVSFGSYADQWVKTRLTKRGLPIRTRTREEYERMLRAPGVKHVNDDGGVLAPFRNLTLSTITTETVRAWYDAQLATGRRTQTSHAYMLLKSILTTALEEGLLGEQPCRIEGAATLRTGIETAPPKNEDQFQALLENTPAAYQALVVIGGASGARYGEATDLRAHEIEVARDDQHEVLYVVVTIDSGVVQVKGDYEEGDPKSLKRKVIIFGEDAEIIASHVAGMEPQQRLFPAVGDKTKPLSQSTFWRHFNKARIAAGMPRTRYHDLRHYAGTRYAQSGATIKETMARLGHTTTSAAMRYQHDADEQRRMELAAAAARPRRKVAATDAAAPAEGSADPALDASAPAE